MLHKEMTSNYPKYLELAWFSKSSTPGEPEVRKKILKSIVHALILNGLESHINSANSSLLRQLWILGVKEKMSTFTRRFDQ